MKKLATICAVILFAIPAAGLAQLNSGVGIGPRLGYYHGQDADDGNFYGGLQLRARLAPVFGLEGAINYRTSQTYKVANSSVNVRQVPLTLTGMLYLPVSEHFEPYALAGLGAYYTIYDFNSDLPGSPDDDHSVDFGYHLGFGISVPISEHVGLDADYRYIFLDPTSDNFGDVDNADFNSNEFTLGLTFYF